MVTKDPWVNWTWDVFAADGPGKAYVKPGSRVGHFKLKHSVDKRSHKRCYVVSFAGIAMPRCWHDRRMQFFPVGTKAPYGVPDLPLDPWNTHPSGSNASNAKWLAAANHVRDLLQTDAKLHHLVSVIYPEGFPEIICLVRVDNAVTDGTPLLTMHLISHIPANRPRQDGTAHGGGHAGH